MGLSNSGVSEAKLSDLIAAAQDDPADDSAAMNEIVRRFQRRAMLLAATMTQRTSLHSDLAQAALIGLVRAVRRHERGRAGFITYAVRYMFGAARREMAPWIGPVTDSLTDPAVWSAACAVASSSPEPGMYCWGHCRAGQAVLTLPQRQRDLLTSRYVDDAALASIAAATGTSIPAVSQRLATAHRVVAAHLAV